MVYFLWTIDNWWNGFSTWIALRLCLSYLTLPLCLVFDHSFEIESFYLDLSWILLISSGLVFAFTWLLGTWMITFVFYFKPSSMCFNVGQCIHPRGYWDTKLRSALVSSMRDEWFTQELRGSRLSWLSSYSYMLDYANG